MPRTHSTVEELYKSMAIKSMCGGVIPAEAGIQENSRHNVLR